MMSGLCSPGLLYYMSPITLSASCIVYTVYSWVPSDTILAVSFTPVILSSTGPPGALHLRLPSGTSFVAIGPSVPTVHSSGPWSLPLGVPSRRDL